MKALEVVDAMARWIILHGEAGRTVDPAQSAVSTPGAHSWKAP